VELLTPAHSKKERRFHPLDEAQGLSAAEVGKGKDETQ
jgi:hypothetical protein